MSQSRRKMHRKLPKLAPLKPVEFLDGIPIIDAEAAGMLNPLEGLVFTPAMFDAASGPYTEMDRLHELEIGRKLKPSERLLRIALNDTNPTGTQVIAVRNE
jgi:hypothetical protein